MAENKIKILTKISSFLDCEKSFQNIETMVNDLTARINAKAESEIKEEEGQTGDTKIIQNADKSFAIEIRTEEGWKKATAGGMPVLYGAKVKDEGSKLKKSIDEIEADDTSTGAEDAKKTIFDEKADKFVLARPDYDSGWVAANDNETTVITHNLELTQEPSLYQCYLSNNSSPVIGTHPLVGAVHIDKGNGLYVDFYSSNVTNVHIGDANLFQGDGFGNSNEVSDIADGFIRLKIWK